MAEWISHGANLEVCGTCPALCVLSRAAVRGMANIEVGVRGSVPQDVNVVEV